MAKQVTYTIKLTPEKRQTWQEFANQHYNGRVSEMLDDLVSKAIDDDEFMKDRMVEEGFYPSELCDD